MISAAPMTDLATLDQQLTADIAAAPDLAALEAIRVAALGKQGSVAALLKTLGSMSPEERKEQGPKINGLRDRVAARISERKAALETESLSAQLAAERVDLTLPPPPRRKGSVHPTMQVMDEMVAIFADMGFAVAEGPDIEDDFHNFTALNFPEKHPAREMHDTFFFNPGPDGERRLLRTHTSPVQVRTMQQTNAPTPVGFTPSQPPPIRIVVPGRTYRKDSDQTHTPMFHQMEGLVIDRGIHMGHLKWTLETFVARFFETDRVGARFRPHHFPFTEPSAEMDIQCDRIGRRNQDRRGERLAGGGRLRHGASERLAPMRHRPGRVAGLRLRLRHRPAGHAEVRHPGPQRHVRLRYALVGALRVQRLRRAEPGERAELRRRR